MNELTDIDINRVAFEGAQKDWSGLRIKEVAYESFVNGAKFAREQLSSGFKNGDTVRVSNDGNLHAEWPQAFFVCYTTDKQFIVSKAQEKAMEFDGDSVYDFCLSEHAYNRFSKKTGERND